MFKRKVDDITLNQLRTELEDIQKYEADAQTPAGKNLLVLLENTIQNTIKELTTKEVDKFDTDAKMILFLASCRSKLQTLIALRDKYTNASVKRKVISDELEKLLQERS